VVTETYLTPATAAALLPRPRIAASDVLMHGTRVSFVPQELPSFSVRMTGTCVAAADAAQSATNGAPGDEAFEDPV
jgi:hypothetical protein